MDKLCPRVGDLKNKRNNMKTFYTQMKRAAENEVKLTSFRKINKKERMSNQKRVFLGKAKAFEDIASERKHFAFANRLYG